MSIRYQHRALDVTLACKLTLTYGKYHLAMLHRELAMSEERTTYQQAERTANMMNQITVFHSSPSDFMHTYEESTDEPIATYRKFKPQHLYINKNRHPFTELKCAIDIPVPSRGTTEFYSVVATFLNSSITFVLGPTLAELSCPDAVYTITYADDGIEVVEHSTMFN